MSSADKDLVDLAKSTTEDFYNLLGVTHESSEQDIKKAYRKASIKYHPDKNPDNKDAADRFIYLGWARDILMSPELKGEYDRARTRRREKAMQDQMLSGRRRTMIEDLERREREASERMGNLKRKRGEEMSEKEKQDELVRRLAEDGKRRRQALTEKRRREAQDQMEKDNNNEHESSLLDSQYGTPVQPPRPFTPATEPPQTHTIKIRFQRQGETMGWDKDKLKTMFSKYGTLAGLATPKDKFLKLPGSKHKSTTPTATAFIIYPSAEHARAAVRAAKADYPELESVMWEGESAGAESDVPTTSSPFLSTPKRNADFSASRGVGGGAGASSTPLGTPKFSFTPKKQSLEEVTMQRLRAAEKKRLEEVIRREEGELGGAAGV